MCRLAAYLGKEMRLSDFLLEPEHSLIKQSWAAKEMQEATLNADGFGISWLSDQDLPCTYKNTLPIWSDTNLDGLGQSISSRLWLANVRSATPGQGVNESNTQPFINDHLMFVHNGFIKPFDTGIKSRLLNMLNNQVQAGINGDSDSQYLFALFQQHYSAETSIVNAIKTMMASLKAFCTDEVTALLNLIISNGETLYACRHAVNGICPSLYYLLDQHNVQIASEGLRADEQWLPFDEHSLIIFDSSGLVDTHKL